MHLGGDNIDMEFYITAVALFCCSGFGWYSTLTEGHRGRSESAVCKVRAGLLHCDDLRVHARQGHLRHPAAAVRDSPVRVYRRTAAVRCAPHRKCSRICPRAAAYADYVGRFSCLQDQIRAAGRSHARADTRYAVQRTLDYVDGVNLKQTLLRVCFSLLDNSPKSYYNSVARFRTIEVHYGFSQTK